MATPVFFMHDGAVDELVCIPFLKSMPNVALSGIWITPSDCLALPTATVCLQLLSFLGDQTTPVYYSDTASSRPFPWTYRQYALMVNLLPLLNRSPGNSTADAIKVPVRKPSKEIAGKIGDTIKNANDQQGEPSVFVITSPLTDLTYFLEWFPDFRREIASIVWMGGSLHAGGNIDTGIAIGANPNAEWNAYWDPYAARSIFASGIPINMFPLDVTNQFTLSADILRKYFLPVAQTSGMLNLVSQMYALVAFQAGYSFWDTAAVAFVGNPSLFSLTPQNIDINTDESDVNGFGCIITQGKYPVNIASTSQVTAFYEYLVQQLASISD